MTIHLDHAIIPCRNQIAAAKQLAELLGVPWAETAIGPFSPVFVNEGLTLDFQQTDESFPVEHFCFRVSDTEFDAIFARIKTAGIAYGSSPRDASNMRIGTDFGGRNVYWRVPEGHMWEILTVSYARQRPGDL